MAERYKQLLGYIHTRYVQGDGSISRSGHIAGSVKPTEVERHFMDFLKIVIEGGWVVQDQDEWISILEFLEAADEIETSLQTQKFFGHVAELFGFTQLFEQTYLLFDD